MDMVVVTSHGYGGCDQLLSVVDAEAILRDNTF